MSHQSSRPRYIPAFNTFESRKFHPHFSSATHAFGRRRCTNVCSYRRLPSGRAHLLYSDNVARALVSFPRRLSLEIRHRPHRLQPPTPPPLSLNAGTYFSNVSKTPQCPPWLTHFLSTFCQHHLLYFRFPGHKLRFCSCFPSIR